MAGRPTNVLPLPRWTIIIHAVQIVLALAILGLDAYGIYWIPYDRLIFSLVATLLTLAFCAYIIATTLFFHKLYNAYIVLGLHVLMFIFWVVDLGLVADLANRWHGRYYGNSSSHNSSYRYHNDKRAYSTPNSAYWGALVAGAIFGAVQLVLWTLTGVLVGMCLNKRRAALGSGETPPIFTGGEQPILSDEQKASLNAQNQYQQQHLAPYPQDPVSGEHTVSPLSQVGYPPNASELHENYSVPTNELSAQHHTRAYDPNVSELSSSQQSGHGNHSVPVNTSGLSAPHHTGAYNPNVSELSSSQQSGHGNHSVPINASGLSAPHHTAAYNPNVSELSG